MTGPTSANNKHEPNTSSNKDRGDENRVSRLLPRCHPLAVRDDVGATMRIYYKGRFRQA